MTTVTLEVPDELASKIFLLRDQMPDLLSKALESRSGKGRTQDAAPKTAQPVFMEIVDFLASNPQLKQIAEFKLSPVAQARLDDLLENNREDGLTEEEARELDTYLELSDVMMLLKFSVK